MNGTHPEWRTNSGERGNPLLHTFPRYSFNISILFAHVKEEPNFINLLDWFCKTVTRWQVHMRLSCACVVLQPYVFADVHWWWLRHTRWAVSSLKDPSTHSRLSRSYIGVRKQQGAARGELVWAGNEREDLSMNLHAQECVSWYFLHFHFVFRAHRWFMPLRACKRSARPFMPMNTTSIIFWIIWKGTENVKICWIIVSFLYTIIKVWLTIIRKGAFEDYHSPKRLK